MSSTTFQKYLEGMNQQPLDKRPRCQDSIVLLPHQRTSPIKRPIANQESIIQTPRDFSNGEIEDDTSRKIDPVDASDVSIKNESQGSRDLSPQYHYRGATPQQNKAQSIEYQSKSFQAQILSPSQAQCPSHLLDQGSRQHVSPEDYNTIKIPGDNIKHGLAKSRWADPSCHGTHASWVGRSLATPAKQIHDRQRETPEKPGTTTCDKRVDINTHFTPVQRFVYSAGNGAGARKPGPSAHDKPNAIQSPRQKQASKVPDIGWDESESAGNRDRGPRHQSPAAIATVSAITPDPEDNANACERKFNNAPHDPRGNWPTELGVHDQVKQDMMDQCRNRTSQHQMESLDDISFSSGMDETIPRYVTTFIETWISGIPSVEANFLSQNIDHHEDCDVNPLDGALMPPIEYPVTRCQELMSRRQTEMTATIFMKQFQAEAARKRKAQRKTERQAKATVRTTEGGTEPVVAEPPNPNEVQIPCHLRPAIQSDVEAITAIYNREISDGYKVMDTKPTRPEDFHRIYTQSLAEKMPFIVAVEGYHGVTDTPNTRIVGFALVTPVNRGIVGSHETLSNRGGKLLVIVEPQYRRKRIGTALIDIVLTNCTGWYISTRGYQFVNFTHDWLSDEFGSNPRKWWYLEMEVMILSGTNEEKNRDGEEFKWIWEFLETKFDMILKHYDEKCFYEPRQMNWLDKLTFRRICRTLGE